MEPGYLMYGRRMKILLNLEEDDDYNERNNNWINRRINKHRK